MLDALTAPLTWPEAILGFGFLFAICWIFR